jgi:hypothetical protein
MSLQIGMPDAVAKGLKSSSLTVLSRLVIGFVVLSVGSEWASFKAKQLTRDLCGSN